MKKISAALFVLATTAVLLMIACSSSTGPAASRNNPGTGTSTLKVTADIEADDDPTVIGGFTTNYQVSLRNSLGAPVSNATVTVTNPALGTITLIESTPGASGDYIKQGSTFPGGDFQLDVVRASDNVRGVVLGGPSPQSVTAPVANATVPANQPLTVRWTVPSRASAQVETKDYGPISVPDTGAHVIPAVNNPPNASQRIRVFRFNEVAIAGGLTGSRMRVIVRKTVEPVIVQ
jgi:hypothetical protein